MEFAPPLTNLRTQLCIILLDCSSSTEKTAAWSPPAEEFLRRMYKFGIQITVVGPRPFRKFGSKKTLRFLDRHEVVGLKSLTASKSHKLEFRILSRKNRSWTRLRAEACVVVGPYGTWPAIYDGWTSPGTLSINALSRWIIEGKSLPGREFAFVGSSNQVFRWASLLLDRGAKKCFVVEQSDSLRCWRSHRDRFISKGGRVLLKHKIQRVQQTQSNALEMYLSNEQGTMILGVDTVVLSPTNDEALNSPTQWKQGLYYLHRRALLQELQADVGFAVERATTTSPFIDEEHWLESEDWRELYWRLTKSFGLVEHPMAEGGLKAVRQERRKMLEYRKPENRKDLTYSGKILDRNSLRNLQASPSVPKSFESKHPMASLECFENIPCRACVDICPESAIEKASLTDLPKLLSDKCTGCGACVAICPTGAAVMIKESSNHQKARYFFSDDTKELWKPGRSIQVVNRKGDLLGAGKVISSTSYQGGLHRVLEVESTNVHLWEARGFKLPKSDFNLNDPLRAAEAIAHQKRGWITLNGVKRLSPVDIPVTMALWKLGVRRFEDALFCEDGNCHLCEIVVNGQPALACKVKVQDEQDIKFSTKSSGLSKPLCPCKQKTEDEYRQYIEDGASVSLTREITEVGSGACHGRWCLSSQSICENALTQPSNRPRFHGFEGSPWREIWAPDVIDPSNLDFEE